MKRNVLVILMVVAVSLIGSLVVQADPGQPNFGPAIYADGEVFGTKGVAALPAPSDSNVDSYDKLFAFTNGAAGQLAVAEAAPGNPDFNGGRWFTHTVTWTEAGLEAHGGPVLLTSYADIQFHEGLGHLTVAAGSFPGGPQPYFLCPLLPVH